MEATGPTTETTSSTTEATGPTTETRALTTKATASTAETPAPTYFREFARLYPTNKTAALAFDRVASKVKADPNWNRHARKYIAIFPDQASLECVGSESESEDGSGPQPHKRLIQIGYYRLNFDMPPRDPRLGWLIGGGKFALGDESPELVLTERKRHDGILGRHAQLFHNYSSGALMLRVSDQSIAIVGGKNVRGLTAIWSITTHISFGNMTYRLDLDDATDGIHQRRLNHYRQINDLAVTDGHVSLLSTPAESDYIHKEYVIKNPVGHGASSTIFAGEHIKTGTAVAVKRMIRDRDNAGSIKQEVQMAKFLGSHHRLCHIVDEMSPDGDRRSANFRNSAFDEVYLIYRPLARTTWQLLCERGPVNDMHHQLCAILFHHCLEGIEYIHSKGVIHRDIKPSNLAIVSFNPPQGRVIGFGSALTGTSSNDVVVGTPQYHSPEMWTMKRSGKAMGLEYDEKVDTFAFGVSAYQIFCQQQAWWSEANEDALDRMKEDLGLLKDVSIFIKHLILSMLANDANLRPSSEGAKKFRMEALKKETQGPSRPSA